MSLDIVTVTPGHIKFLGPNQKIRSLAHPSGRHGLVPFSNRALWCVLSPKSRVPLTITNDGDPARPAFPTAMCPAPRRTVYSDCQTHERNERNFLPNFQNSARHERLARVRVGRSTHRHHIVGERPRFRAELCLLAPSTFFRLFLLQSSLISEQKETYDLLHDLLSSVWLLV